MHIIITGIHLEVTEAIHSYVLSKLTVLDKYIRSDDTSAKLSVELSRVTNHHQHGQVYKAEGHLHIRGRTVTLEATEEDLYKAIDVLRDMLIRDVSTHKDKERSILRRSAHKIKQV